SSASMPSLRERAAHPAIASISRDASCTGGITIQRARRIPSLNTRHGLCTSTAASVPPTTMMNAASCTSDPSWPPSSHCPPIIARNASARPARLRMSTTGLYLECSSSVIGRHEAMAQPRPTFLPLAQTGAQSRDGLAVELAHTRLAHLEHRRDLLEVHVLLVVEAHQQLLALRQRFDGLHQRAAKACVL